MNDATPDPVTTLRVEPLTREAFAPFGEVIAFGAATKVFPINNGTTQRHHALARVDVGGGHGLISLARAEPRTLPFAVTMLERHPLGSQAFIPLSKTPYLIVVAESPDHPPRCFLAAHGEGVNYHAGTWHHPLIALDEVSDFLIVDRGGEGHNCDEASMPRTWWILDVPRELRIDDEYVASLEHDLILNRLAAYFGTRVGIDISSTDAPLCARIDFHGGTDREFCLARNSPDFDIAPHLDFVSRVLDDTRGDWTIVLMDWTADPEREIGRYRKPAS